jgi:hypothetical protein
MRVGIVFSIILLAGFDRTVWGTEYVAIDLTPSGFRSSEIVGASGTQQVGWGYLTGLGVHALLWSGSAASAIDLNPSGYDYSYAKGISDGAQVGYGRGSATSK